MDLMHQIHSVEVKPDELPDMKKQALGWAETCRNYMSSDICNRLISLVEEISDCHTLLHADFHINNILVCGDELMLIDMETLCSGDPIFEMSSLYNSYIEFPSIDPVAAKIFGIDVETARRLWDSSLELYLGGDKDKKNEFARKVLLLGCMRIIDFMNRHKDHPGFERCINICSQDISKHL